MAGEDGKLIFDTKLDTAGLEKGLKGLDRKISSVLKVATTAIGGAATAVAGLGVAAIKVGSGFESSMSNVAATMGITADEISRGSAEFELLREAAKKAGETTKYSASQSAEALNYLALAGYDARKAADALPAVLNLAAAGNMDLAYAADLATDAMAALGIEATTANLTAFGDKMAVAAQKSNTSVAQLGEAILTVGGTAKILAGGTVELNTALGVLANRGLKGSESGTKLRNIILALTAPTNNAAAAIEELGITVADAEGNLRPINEVFKDLDESMNGMSEIAKKDILNTIFNRQDLAAVEGLLAGCGDEFDNLSRAIADSSGAMSEMAATQMDNLKGDIDILKSALEDLGISFYESNLSDFARNVVQTVTDMVGQLSEALKDGGIQGFAEALGDVLANAITKIAEKAPDLINAGVTLISSFLDGLNKNADRIGKAAADIGTALVKGLIKIIPKVAETAGKILKAFATELGKAVPTLKPFTAILGAVADHMKTLIPLLIAGYAAFKAYQGLSAIANIFSTIVKTITGLVAGYQAATVQLALYNAQMGVSVISETSHLTALSAKEIMIGVLNGQVSIATALQYAWNTAVNLFPGVILVTALAAVVTAIALYKGKAEESASAQDKLNESLRKGAEEALESAQKNKEAYEDMAEARDKRIASDMAQLESTQHLAQELEGLIDANGRVKDGEEEHAQMIIEQLNGALGLELELVDGLIQGEENLAKAIEEAIEKKKAQLLLQAHEEEYLQALEDKAKFVREAVEAEEQYAKAAALAKDAQNEATEAYRAYEDAVMSGVGDADQLLTAWQNAQAKADEYNQTAGECMAVVQETRDNIERAAKDIINWEDAQTAVMEGDYEKAVDILSNAADAFKTSADLIGKSEEEKVRILKEQYEQAQKDRDYMYQMLEGIDSEGADKLRAQFDDYAAKAEAEWRNAANANTEGYAEEIANGEEKIESAIGSATTGAIEGQKGPSYIEAKSLGEYMAEGIAAGIRGRIAAASHAMSELTSAVLAQAHRDTKTASPSRLFRDEIGVRIAEGVAVGIEIGTDKAVDAISSLSDICLKKAWEKGGNWADIGANYVKYMEDGLKENADDVIDLVKETVDNMVEEISNELDEDSKDEKKAVKKAGDTLVDGYKEAINEGLTEAKEMISARFKDISKEWQDKTDEILKKREDMRKKLAGYGGDLFETDEEDNLVVKNLEDNISALERYDAALSSIKEKGVSEGLLNEILGMNIENGTAFAEALDAMSSEQFAGYITSWEEQQAKAREISEKFFAGEIEALDKEYTGKLNEALDDIPEMVKDIGINTVEGLAEGMLSKMGVAVEAAQRIADAIQSTLSEAMEIHSPSRWAKRVIAGNTLAGIAEGFREGMPKLKGDVEKSMDLFKKISLSVGESPFGTDSYSGNLIRTGTVTETHTKVVEREKVVGISFNGRLKDVARLLKPSLDDEDRRIGRTLVKAT